MTDCTRTRVLVVDDNADTRANLRDILELHGHHVETAGSCREALERNSWACIDVVLLDRMLPDGTAEELLPVLVQRAPQAAVIVVTGMGDIQNAVQALRLGAADYILKPISSEALLASLNRVAERRRLQREKARSEAVFRTLVENAPCMILILRPDRSIAYFSPFAEEVTGYLATEVMGIDYFATFLPEGVRASVASEVQRVLEGQPSRGYENPVLCKDGSQRWVVWNAELLADYEGGPALLAVGQDITRLKQAQEKAVQSERLAAIGQMVTGLAHESGNALARSQACLEMLALEVEDRPEALDLIARIQNAQDHLQHLYEEVRGYAAPLRLDRDSWDVSGIWRQAWNNLAVLRQGRQAVLEEETNGLDLTCPVDSFRLEQVFRNILENSLAACRDPVYIRISCQDARLEGHPALCIRITDNGPGLSADQRQRIFEPFFTTKTKGTGLGMAIAKRIVEAHGGQINVGQPRSGAEIVITLPRESA